MKKFIFIVNAIEVVAGLMAGQKYEGVLFLDRETRVLTFKPWNRKTPKWRRERKIRDLDFGWLGESERHIVRHERFPKQLGFSNILKMMDEDNCQSKTAMVNRQIIETA